MIIFLLNLGSTHDLTTGLIAYHHPVRTYAHTQTQHCPHCVSAVEHSHHSNQRVADAHRLAPLAFATLTLRIT